MLHDSGDHATDEVLEQYSLGTLPEREVERFEEHLLVCPSCQDRLAETDRFIRAFRSAINGVQASPPSETGFADRVLRTVLRPAPALAVTLSILAVVVGLNMYAPPSGHVAAVPVLLRTQRGGFSDSAPAGTPLSLRLDAAGMAESPHYRIEIVNTSGAALARLPASRDGDSIALETAREFAAGSYWVRAYDGSGRLLREYALRVSENAAR